MHPHFHKVYDDGYLYIINMDELDTDSLVGYIRGLFPDNSRLFIPVIRILPVSDMMVF